MEGLKTDELEIISWALDDHAVKILMRASAYSQHRPNLAYLDTIILKHKVDDELARRRSGTQLEDV